MRALVDHDREKFAWKFIAFLRWSFEGKEWKNSVVFGIDRWMPEWMNETTKHPLLRSPWLSTILRFLMKNANGDWKMRKQKPIWASSKENTLDEKMFPCFYGIWPLNHAVMWFSWKSRVQSVLWERSLSVDASEKQLFEIRWDTFVSLFDSWNSSQGD